MGRTKNWEGRGGPNKELGGEGWAEQRTRRGGVEWGEKN